MRTWCERMTERFHVASSSAGRANSVDALGRRLRRKFILVAMGTVTVVLTLIIAGINIVNYSHVCKMADARLDYILAGKDGIDWGGTSLKAIPLMARMPAMAKRAFASATSKA